MGRVSTDSPRLTDPDLPAVDTLMGPGARELLDVVLAPSGERTATFRPRQVTWWPGRSITVRYELTSQSGTPVPQVVAVAGSIPDGVAILEADDLRVGVWSLPNDPSLPGLASVLDPRTLRPMLQSLGLPARDVIPRFRAYRPGRRAVVQVDVDDTRVFVKLGRPKDIGRLHETHRAMAEVLPVPTSLGFDPDLGILVMPAGHGITLRQALDTGADLPSPADLQALLDRVPDPVGPARTRSPISKLASLVELLTRIVPDQSSRLGSIAEAIGEDPELDPSPVHGDFHDGQLLIAEGRVTGLLDVDTHALGHDADDPATMLGHLYSRLPHAPDPVRIEGFIADLAHHWATRVDGGELRRRMGAVALGLATGPFRVQQEDWPAHVRTRIARAESLLTDENPLISLSG